MQSLFECMMITQNIPKTWQRTEDSAECYLSHLDNIREGCVCKEYEIQNKYRCGQGKAGYYCNDGMSR
jgi:hypothetical protein